MASAEELESVTLVTLLEWPTDWKANWIPGSRPFHFAHRSPDQKQSWSPRGPGWAMPIGASSNRCVNCRLDCGQPHDPALAPFYHSAEAAILCDLMDCSPPGSSVHGISQARVLEWVDTPSSRKSSWPRDGTRASCVSCIAGGLLYLWTTGGSPVSPLTRPNCRPSNRSMTQLQPGFTSTLAAVSLSMDPAGENQEKALPKPVCRD